MEIFSSLQIVNDLINEGDDEGARNELIQVLDKYNNEETQYGELINSLVRKVGLYPYIDKSTASWEERFIYEAFKVDVGANKKLTLHREQSNVLNKLLSGQSLAISAPTSFGKSFIIDSFISIAKPRNIMIIVPTVALTDETRRRIQQKFSEDYKIITTSEAELDEKNIFIFPQERAIHYVNDIDELDMLVVDEFYKASPAFDKERSPSLLKAIMRLGEKANQRYFLAPNISDLAESFFTKGMEFIEINFNTVFLEKHEMFKEINGDELRENLNSTVENSTVET